MRLKKLFSLGLALALSFGFAVTPARADQDPLACDSNGVGLSLTVFRDDETTVIAGGSTVESGETIKYRATLSHLGGSNCNFDGGILSIITPDGVSHEMTNPVPLVSTGSPHVSGFQSYVVSESDVISDNLQAEADYSGGSSHTGEVHDNAAASVDRNTPYQDIALEVTKDAVPSFNRECAWEIDKTVDVDNHELTDGDSGTSEYEVTVEGDCEDTDYAVTGTITIYNPAEYADAIITSVTDSVDGIVATVDCTEDENFTGFPYNLPAGETLTCTYSADLPDGTTLLNTATATTSGDVDGGEGTADVDFDGVEPTLVGYEEVNIDDSYEGELGTCIADEGPCVFTYERIFTCSEDAGEHENIAIIVETEQTASATVNVTCTTIGTCTLTQGYWKTHSQQGPAPYDAEGWGALGGDEEGEIFFLSGMTWLEVFNTAPKGNAYYNLAHQYMAAYLNVANGASVPSEVQDALDDAEDLFNNYTPEDIAALKGNNALRQEFIALAGILGSYNEGQIGPGHCE